MALSGTRTERNTSSRSRKASPTTTTRYFGKASARLWETSTPTAVWPVTYGVAPVWACSDARSVRRVPTRSLVSWVDGPLFGITVIVAKPSWSS